MSAPAVAPPAPGSAEWRKLLTASKVPALLGLSPWQSPYSLWHEMKGLDPGRPATDATRRGNYLEAGVLEWCLDQHPEFNEVEPQHYATLDALPWAAATLDALAHQSDGTPLVVEVKTAARADEWGQPGTDEIPAHYAAQVMWQLAMIPDAPRAHVAVLLGPGLTFAEYVIERDDNLIGHIVTRAEAWMRSLEQDDPPALDDTVATIESLRRQHPRIDPDAQTVLDRADATEYVGALAAEKTAQARARAAKAVVLDAMGDARLAVLDDGTTIARRQPARGDSVSLIAVAKTLKEKTP